MGKAQFEARLIPVISDTAEVIGKKAYVAEGEHEITCVSMGNPHCVLFVDEVDNLELSKIGPAFENDSMFPERVNTEFVKIIDGRTLKMRVWERGSGETLACGTGACAVVSAAVKNGICPAGEDIKVILLGGELTVNYTDDRVLMTGPATKVFEGTIRESL